jgi:hypothetical protein
VATASVDPNDPFEREAIGLLERHGFSVVSRLSVPGLPTGLVVKHPRLDDRYLCAVQCDERSTATNRGRQQLLEGLGWKVLRVWSADWYRNQQAAERRLVDQVKALAATA